MARLATLFRGRFRFFILVLGTLCLSSIFSNVLTINFSLICMDLTRKGDEILFNSTTSKTQPTPSYTPYDKMLLQWAVSLSSLAATFPLSWACTRYGARHIFLVSGLLSAIATALIPLAVELGLVAFLATRVLQGLAYACDFAVIGVLCTRWASLRENAIFIAMLTCFTPIASVFTSLLSGIVCNLSYLGWPWVHYTHAILSLVLFATWALFYTDSPRGNAYVSDRELDVIHRQKTDAHKNHDTDIPYRVIFQSKVIWAVWLNAFLDLTCGFFVLIYLPTYFNKVLLLDISNIGTLGAFVFAMNVPLKIFSGYVSDAFNCWPEKIKMSMFNTVASIVPAAVYVAMCFVPSGHPGIVVAFFATILGSIGFNAGGFYKCGALTSRQYAEFVIACTQFIKCLVFFVAPALVAFFVQDETNASQWHAIFIILAVSLVLGNVIFCVYATDKPCNFTHVNVPKLTCPSAGRA